MNLFRNLKIGLKLFISFGVALVLMFILIVYAVSQQRYVSYRFRDITDSTMMQSIELLNVQIYAENIRRATAAATAHSAIGNIAAINAASDELTEHFSNVMQRLDAFNEATRDNDMYSLDEIEETISASNDLRDIITSYYNNISRPVIQYALEEDFGSALNRVGTGASTILEMLTQLESLRTNVRNHRDAHVDYVHTTVDSTIINLIVVGVAIFFGTLVLAYIVSKAISKPIKNLVKMSKEVADGNLNINMDYSKITKDEIGDLTDAVYSIVDIINHIVTDLEKLSDEFIEAGDIDYRMDTSKYNNAFRDVMD